MARSKSSLADALHPKAERAARRDEGGQLAGGRPDVLEPIRELPSGRPPKGVTMTVSRSDGRIGQTVRLYPDAWKLLRVLAAQEYVDAHDLLIEGVNHVFRERGLPQLARQAGSREVRPQGRARVKALAG